MPSSATWRGWKRTAIPTTSCKCAGPRAITARRTSGSWTRCGDWNAQPRLPQAHHRHDEPDVPRVRAALRGQDADLPRRLHSLLGRRHGLFRPRNRHEPALGRPAAASRDDLGGQRHRPIFPPPISRRPGRTSPSTANTPGAPTTASASPTCPSSRRNGSSSRPGPWMPTGNRGNCWRRPSRRRRRVTARQGAGSSGAIAVDVFNTASWPRTDL